MLWWLLLRGIFVILWGFDRLKFSIFIPLLHNVPLVSFSRIDARKGRWQRHTNNHPKAQGEMMVKKDLEEKFLNQLFVIPLFRYSVITKFRFYSNTPRSIAFRIGWAAPKRITYIFAFFGHSF